MIPSRRPVVILRGHHTDEVRSVVVSPDGKTIFSGSHDKTVRLYDTQSQQTSVPLQGHDDWVLSLAVSPNGKILYSGGRDKKVCVWDVETTQIIETLPHADAVYSLIVSEDETLLFSGDRNGDLCVWDTQNYTCLQRLPAPQKMNNSLDLALSLDSRRLLFSASIDKTIRVFTTQPKLEWLFNLSGHADSVRCVVVSPNGKVLYSGSYDRNIVFWDIDDASNVKPIAQIASHTDWITDLALSANGANLVSASRDQTIRLWETSSRECLGILRGHSNSVLSVAVSSSGGKEPSIVVSGSKDETLGIWNVTVGPTSTQFLPAHSPSCGTALAVSADNQCLFFSSNRTTSKDSTNDNDTICQWSLTSNEQVATFHGHSSGGVRNLALSPNGNLLAFCSQDGSVGVWDIGNKESIGTVVTAPDAANAATTTTTTTVADNKTAIFSADSNTLVIGKSNGDIHLFHVASLESVGSLRGHQDAILSLVASSSKLGKIFSASADGTVRVWGGGFVHDDSPYCGGSCLGVLKGHECAVCSLALSPCEELLASGSNDKTIRLWDTDTLSHLGTLEGSDGPVLTLAIHQYDSGSKTLLFAPSAVNKGIHIFSAGEEPNAKIRQWNSQTQVCTATIPITTTASSISSIVLSSDGEFLFARDSNGTISTLVLSSMIRHDGRRCNLSYSLPLSPLSVNDLFFKSLAEAARKEEGREEGEAYDWHRFRAILDKGLLRYALSSDLGNTQKVSVEERQNLWMPEEATHVNTLHLAVSKGDVAAAFLHSMLRFAPHELFQVRHGPPLVVTGEEPLQEKCSLLSQAAARPKHGNTLHIIFEAFMDLVIGWEKSQKALQLIMNDLDIWNATLDFDKLEQFLTIPNNVGEPATSPWWQLIAMDEGRMAESPALVDWCLEKMPSLASEGLVGAYHHKDETLRLSCVQRFVDAALEEGNKPQTESLLLREYSDAVGSTTTWHRMVTLEEFDQVVFKIMKAFPFLHLRRDPNRRTAYALAAPDCRHQINKAVLFCGKYSLGEELHQSATSMVLMAKQMTHHKDTPGTKKFSEVNKEEEEVQVVVKFIAHEDMYRREIDEREGLDDSYIVPVLAKSEDYNDWKEQVKRLELKGGQYPHGIIMPAARRNLMVALLQGRATYDEARGMQLQLAQALHHLHTQNKVHGDFKPLNVVRMDDLTWRLIDFDAAVNMNSPVGAKTSSAYCPPEMTTIVQYHDITNEVNTISSAEAFELNVRHSVQKDSPQAEQGEVVLRRYVGNGTAQNPFKLVDDRYTEITDFSYKLIHAEPSFDLWSYGVVLYRTLARKALFDSDFADNLTSGLETQRLHSWGHADVETAMDEVKSVLRFDFGLDSRRRLAASELLGWLLQPDPRKRPSNFSEVMCHAFFQSIDEPATTSKTLVRGQWRMNPIHLAASLGHANEIMKEIAADSEMINAKCPTLGKTPLHLAAEDGHLEAVETLIQHEYCVASEKDLLGNTAVHSAIAKAEQAAVRRDWALVAKLVRVLELLLMKRRSAFQEKSGTGDLSGLELGRNSKVREVRELFRGKSTILNAIRNCDDFDVDDFNSLWLRPENQSSLRDAIFQLLKSWAFSESDGKTIESKRSYLCRNIYPCMMWEEDQTVFTPEGLSPFEQLQELAQKRMEEVLEELFSICDEMVESESGKLLMDLDSIGGGATTEIMTPLASDCVAAGRGSESMKKEVDENVLVPLVRAIAEEVKTEFEGRLRNALADGQTVFIDQRDAAENVLREHPDWLRWCLVAPVKGSSRLKEKVKGYAMESKGEWPFISQVGDVLRAMVVCRGGPTAGDTILRTWEQLQNAFDIKEGHGRLKNNFRAAMRKMPDAKRGAQKPPDMLINAVFDVKGAMSLVVEVQVHHETILSLKESKAHLLYEIVRADSIESLRDKEPRIHTQEKCLQHTSEQVIEKDAKIQTQAQQLRNQAKELQEKEVQLKEQAVKLQQLNLMLEKLRLGEM